LDFTVILMFILHYLIPLVVFYFWRNSIALWGLLAGNLIDLDHIYMRIIGAFPWFGSACQHFGQNCSIGVYPLHSWLLAGIFLLGTNLAFFRDKRIKLIGFIFLGAFLNILLDYIAMVTGFGI
jgi:hypothetical protein